MTPEEIRALAIECGLDDLQYAYPKSFSAYTAAVESNMRERCANVLNLNNSEIMLMAGDMTAQELRSVNAVLNAFQGKIRSLK